MRVFGALAELNHQIEPDFERCEEFEAHLAGCQAGPEHRHFSFKLNLNARYS
jgi:hypothetical protein